MTEAGIHVVYRSSEFVNHDFLFRAKANQVKILRSRGFTIPPENSIYEWKTPEDYPRAFRAFQRILHRRGVDICDYLSQDYYNEETGESIYVAFIDDPNTNTKELVTRVNLLCNEKKISKVLAITCGKISRDNLSSFELIGISWEIHREQDMSVDRFNHVLDSKATPLTNEEKKEFFDRTGLRAYQLAQYKNHGKRKKNRRDPLLQLHDLPKGTLVKIIHENYFLPTVACETYAYRVVW